MKKILFTQSNVVELLVKNGNPTGGGGAIIETLVWMKAFNQLGYKVMLLRDKSDSRSILNEYSWIDFVPTYDNKKGIKWLRWFYYRIPEIWKSLKSIQPDYIYESIPSWTSFFLIIISKKLNIYHIIRIASDITLDKRVYLKNSKFEKILTYKAIGSSNIVLVQNNYQLERIKQIWPEQKVLKFFNPFVINKKYLIPKDSMEGYIAWVANFRFEKNFKLLYEIASLLKDEEFKIAGSPTRHMDEETTQYYSKLQMLPNVSFVGSIPQSEILDFFSKAKFLLNTSRGEGYSNTFIEAMATGTPILTTPLVNPDGIIDNFNLGILYNSPEELKTNLSSLKSIDYLKCSTNCIDFIVKNHDHIYIGQELHHYLTNSRI